VRETAARDERALGIGLGLTSFVVLSYQVTQLRVFAYAMNPVLVYSVITMTMLGFGAASTAVALSPRLRSLPLRPLVAACCVALALSGLVAAVAVAQLAPDLIFGSGRLGRFLLAIVGIVVLSTLPYIAGGLVVTLVLTHGHSRAGRLYFFNLLGSGLGCFTVMLALRPLGAERLTVALLVLAALGGALLAPRDNRRLRQVALLVGAALAVAIPWAPRLIALEPDPTDQHGMMAQAYRQAGGGEPVREHAAWDPVARVEVHAWPEQRAKLPAPTPFKILTQDGGAASLLLAVDKDPEKGAHIFGNTAYGIAFKLRPAATVLVIGAGGTPDVQAALLHGARHVTAVEINASTVAAMTGPFADFLGRPLARDEVEVVVADGRSYVRGTERRFDVIQVSGADTLTLQSSGAAVLAEDYLYTEEAFADYLSALSDRGMLALLRFAHEPFRLSVTAVKVLRELGATEPERHVVILSHRQLHATLVKRTPWTADELGTLDAFVAQSAQTNRGLELLAFDIFDFGLSAPLRYSYAPHRPNASPSYAALFAEVRQGGLPDIVLPTDDRPYYLAAEWMSYLEGRPVPPQLGDMFDAYVGYISVVVLLALGAVLLPPLVLRFRGQGRPSLRLSAGTLVYFTVLGFCYMFLEIGFIQKAAIVVEHPAYAVAVVLASLLVASSFGSLASQHLRLSLRRLVLVAVGGIVLFGGIYALWLNDIFRALMPVSFGWRMAAVALLIAPLGAAMGMLFPTGLRLVGRSGEAASPLVAWAIASNGFASVLGSVLSFPFTALYGFSALFGWGVAIYLAGALAFVGLTGARAARPA